MTRAVLLRRAPMGTRCTLCCHELDGRKGKRPSVCCNVYEDGKWVRVEHFHPEHYDGRHGVPTRAKVTSVALAWA